MLLGPVSWLDCVVFLVLLIPQLIIHVGIFRTLHCGFWALPFLGMILGSLVLILFIAIAIIPGNGSASGSRLNFGAIPDDPAVFKLPLTFVHERFLLRRRSQPLFVQQASYFEDIVIRCVRYAFMYIPANIGRVFFSKPVALPFLRFRMLRHGYFRSPLHWSEVKGQNFRGIWITADESREPDVLIYYIHGGGFSMGSSYFYLEFLLAWLSLLKTTGGFRNPAIFSLEYTLVPENSYPTQIQQAIAGYRHVLTIAHDASRVCVSGDSAGATLILSLLLHLANGGGNKPEIDNSNKMEAILPEMAVLISPWVTLVSTQYQDTLSDYLNTDKLILYARQYAGSRILIDDPLVSPGNCKDLNWWKRASPSQGFAIFYGSEEVLTPEIIDLVDLLQTAEVNVEAVEEEGGIHAWPLASLFLSSKRERRQKGLGIIVSKIHERMGGG